MNIMFSIALPFPNMVHLYATVNAQPVCHEEEMVANNEYREFRTETNGEFKEMHFDGREYEVPSNTFTELDMNAVDNI
ncbi:uncharacterized protein E5676_scaffold1317G00370 [Cucumis melo var. makuwa]|uniref:Uncharacterized protein n=2 Tax=Cucumis melo TaxID=3656 RepID=A0A5D3BZT0_CUCMM|nr:uncharacterized protein E6C27_scaffold466G00530 [Cucumis melo var. makuwa]TYK05067.1 uncharacterized protein E5676_scaffold1317G00370 [Cucumis melo var. makuwa]